MIGRMAVLVGAFGLLGGAPAFAACTTTIGSVMSLTGSLAAIGQPDAKATQLGVADLNAAGGINGCTLKLSVLDDQTSPSVGVDAAKKLVDITHVPAIVGSLSSGITAAILTSVTAPSHVVLISPASTSPTFTKLAEQGKTGGYWFRTVPSDALQGTAMAEVAHKAGFKKVAILYLNNAYGQGLSSAFMTSFKPMGGTVTQDVAYNPSQPSYMAEVTKAMSPKPDALFLIGYPGDGTTVMRQWIAAGGPQILLAPDGLNSQKFVNDVGAQYLKDVHGTVPGSAKSPSLTTFQAEYKAKYGSEVGPFIANSYDAAVVIGLAMEEAKSTTGTAIRDAIRKVTDPNGIKVYAGVAELKKARELLAENKTIQYVGATGPLHFDKNGDILAPIQTWSVVKGKVTPTGEITVAQIQKIKSAAAKE